jgi:hypothetical protein
MGWHVNCLRTSTYVRPRSRRELVCLLLLDVSRQASECVKPRLDASFS